MATIDGTAGNDSLIGTSGGDDFHMEAGGHDTVAGGDGIDVFYFADVFDSGDQIDGGAGHDYLVLNGDYSAGVALGASSLANVETVQLVAGHDYKFTGLSDANLVGGTITIDGSALGTGDRLSFDASGVATGAVSILGGAGADVLTGGDGNDTISGLAGRDSIRGGVGNDVLSGGPGATLGGGQGDDHLTVTGGPATIQGGEGSDFVFMSDFNSATVIDGGDGSDQVNITGDHASFTISAGMMTGVEFLDLARYDKVKLGAGLVGRGETLQVIAGSAQYSDGGISVDGHKEKGDLVLIGGGLRDVLTGGAGDDTISGGNTRNDVITGGKGADVMSGGHQYGPRIDGATFIYRAVHDSTVAASDEIKGLANDQTIDLHRIDADTTQAGDQAFRLVGALGGHAGDLTLAYDSFRDVTTLSGDVDGDGTADFQVLLDGNQTGFSHFVL